MSFYVKCVKDTQEIYAAGFQTCVVFMRNTFDDVTGLSVHVHSQQELFEAAGLAKVLHCRALERMSLLVNKQMLEPKDPEVASIYVGITKDNRHIMHNKSANFVVILGMERDSGDTIKPHISMLGINTYSDYATLLGMIEAFLQQAAEKIGSLTSKGVKQGATEPMSITPTANDINLG